MSSLLRYAVTPAIATPIETIQRPTAQSPPAKKQKMSLTQTYYLAHTARGKLSKEAARGDHNLRLLVGHANLLDGLMLDLANAEQEQESWFNQTVKSAAKASSEDKQSQRVTWADQHTITEEEMFDEDSESDSDDDEEMEVAVAARKITAQPMQISLSEDEDEEMEDDEFDEELSLTRSPSRGRSQSLSPPELMHEDSDSDDSEDDSMPSSPPPTELLISEKARQAIATTSFYQSPSKPIDGFLYSEESQQIAIAAY